jgi:hypothetical protein
MAAKLSDLATGFRPDISCPVLLVCSLFLEGTVVPPYLQIQYPQFTAARKNNGCLKERFLSFKMRAKRERARTW